MCDCGMNDTDPGEELGVRSLELRWRERRMLVLTGGHSPEAKR